MVAMKLFLAVLATSIMVTWSQQMEVKKDLAYYCELMPELTRCVEYKQQQKENQQQQEKQQQKDEQSVTGIDLEKWLRKQQQEFDKAKQDFVQHHTKLVQKQQDAFMTEQQKKLDNHLKDVLEIQQRQKTSQHHGGGFVERLAGMEDALENDDLEGDWQEDVLEGKELKDEGKVNANDTLTTVSGAANVILIVIVAALVAYVAAIKCRKNEITEPAMQMNQINVYDSVDGDAEFDDGMENIPI